MRVSPVAAFLVSLSLAGRAAATDEVRYAAEVKEEAEVRSCPGTGDPVYVTNKLLKGAIVQVVDELENGWLKIRPPHGSFSYINTRFLQHLAGGNWVVTTPQDVRIPVFVGSNLNPNERGTQTTCTLVCGAQVVDCGTPLLIHEDESWLRIEPPPGECRYIRASAVRKIDVVPPTPDTPMRVTRPSVASEPASAERPPAMAVPPAPAADAGLAGLKRAAENAVKQGRYAEAIASYNQYLENGQRMGVLDEKEITTTRNRIATLQQAAARPAAVPSATSPPVVAIPPRSAPPPVAPPADGFPSSGPGYLSRSGRRVDDQTAYRLESTQGSPMLYAIPRQGVDLEPYIGRKVELIGPAVYRGDLRANFMTVLRIREVP